jgi:ethanolamine ammonia-lyase small subunit
MTKPSDSLVRRDPWQALRSKTPARIALGRAGGSLPSAEVLRFGLAHAQARDAVHCALDEEALARELGAAGFLHYRARSMAPDRGTYLKRPDLGRRLNEDDRLALESGPPAAELAIVIADGLSAIAVQRHALPLLQALRRRFAADWAQTPVVIARQGRVALGDDIGEALRATLVAVLIGERPGLSSPDSLGVYLTYAPRRGRMDSERNCLSNIRPEGLGYDAAAHKLAFLLQAALRLRLTGVSLKEDAATAVLPEAHQPDGRDGG